MAHIVSLIALVCVLAAIFMLTRQNTRQTGDAALRVERWLMRLVHPTGTGSIGEPTWAGLTIRQLAHIAEFGALGLAAGVTCAFAFGGGLFSWALSASLCLCASLADEVHKHFVPGRHFDAHDLALDAFGYLTSTTIVALVAHLMT